MQAARGASLIDSADTRTTSRRRHLLVFALVFAAAYALDVVTKIVAMDRLAGRPDVQVLGEILQLRLVRNPGAAFSMGAQFTEMLSVLAIVACCFVVYLARRLGSTAWAISLGLLLAGIGGNLTDRLVRDPGPLRGHVVDFLMLPNWPVFNVADICINGGAVLVLVLTFRGLELDGTRGPGAA